MSMHIAVKCAWNNADYKAKCSDCPKTNPSCAKKAIHVTTKECWERHLFSDFEFGLVENRHILNTGSGRLVFFTTKIPFSNHRNVFAVSRIVKIDRTRHFPAYPPFPACWSDMVQFDPEMTIDLPRTIDLNFDTYYGKPWNQGLYRYIENEVALELLRGLRVELNKTQKVDSKLQILDRLEQSI
jgi:hypothetical protein